MKYILVTGGVISGLGKGVVSSSLGALLQGSGKIVTAIKIDPYINIDAGTFSPYEHGEVFVLDDGGEVDLDLGNYERFLDIRLRRDNNITTGKIFLNVIQKERRGDYIGRTVQYVPHVTEEIQDWVERVAKEPIRTDNNGHGGIPEICIIELGGTIGDIESASFVEAFRFFQNRVGPNNFFNVHLSPVLEPKSTGEQKSKPTQRSVMELRKLGLQPDVIMCRCDKPLSPEIRKKISLFCNVSSNQVISVHDVESIYQVPLLLHQQGILSILSDKLDLQLSYPEDLSSTSDNSLLLKKWLRLADAESKCQKEVKITLVGKYTKLEDSYASVIKALKHASHHLQLKLVLTYLEGTDIENNLNKAREKLAAMDGLLVPGGFDHRGVEGMIEAIKYARLNKKPFLGICLGFQCAAIEFARNVLGLSGASSTEFNPEAPHKVVIDMPEHTGKDMGGTMRLGLRETKFTAHNSLLKKLYGNKKSIKERHRHRYEINPDYVELFEQKGMRFTGKGAKTDFSQAQVDNITRNEAKKASDFNDQVIRMEILELDDHPYFVAVQYHPEFLTRPLKPSPPFLGLIASSFGGLSMLDGILE